MGSNRTSEFYSEDPGFDPLAGQVEKQFLCPSSLTLESESTLVLFVPEPPSCVRHRVPTDFL